MREFIVGKCLENVSMTDEQYKKYLEIDIHQMSLLRKELGQFVGWDGIKFKWAVICRNKNSLSEYSPINKNGEIISIFVQDRTIKSFDTKDEAEKYVNELMKNSSEYEYKVIRCI